MAKSFIEYMQESEELLEAVHPEMYDMFTRVEIQELGRKLSKLGLSLQNSEVQPWGPKGFKLKHAKEHRLHIVKIKGRAGYVILYYVNARSADIVDNTTGYDFSNSKEVYSRAEKVFSFNTAVDTNKLRDQRWANKFDFVDPLVRNQATREDRLQVLKNKKNNTYAKQLVDNLKRHGIRMVNPRVEGGVFYADELGIANLGKYVHKDIVQVGMKERPMLKITINKPLTGSGSIDSLISELQDVLDAAEALDSISFNELKID